MILCEILHHLGWLKTRKRSWDVYHRFQLVQEFFHPQYLWNYMLVDFFRLEIQILMPLTGSMVGCFHGCFNNSQPPQQTHQHHFLNTMGLGFLNTCFNTCFVGQLIMLVCSSSSCSVFWGSTHYLMSLPLLLG